MAVRKWSVSIDEHLAAQVEEHIGDRGLSAFVVRAVEHELEREKLNEYLDELDRQFGTVPEDLVEDYDAQWPS
jgi:metal-responsive CopG/Arc/MetJ family transcriptional regulator